RPPRPPARRPGGRPPPPHPPHRGPARLARRPPAPARGPRLPLRPRLPGRPRRLAPPRDLPGRARAVRRVHPGGLLRGALPPPGRRVRRPRGVRRPPRPPVPHRRRERGAAAGPRPPPRLRPLRHGGVPLRGRPRPLRRRGDGAAGRGRRAPRRPRRAPPPGRVTRGGARGTRRWNRSPERPIFPARDHSGCNHVVPHENVRRLAAGGGGVPAGQRRGGPPPGRARPHGAVGGRQAEVARRPDPPRTRGRHALAAPPLPPAVTAHPRRTRSHANAPPSCEASIVVRGVGQRTTVNRCVSTCPPTSSRAR